MAIRSPFANAPASQMWVLAVVGASLATWSMHWKDHMVLDRLSVFNWAIWRGATSPFVAMSVPELIMSIVMLQQMRTIERRMGTNKFAAFSSMAAIFTAVMQFSTIALFPSKKLVFGGPGGLIFAGLVQYIRSVPAVAHFRILGIPLNDKWIIYLTASALACWQGTSSLLTCAFGAIFGMLYQPSSRVGPSFGFGRSLRFPSSISRLATSLFSPLLSISDGSAGPQLTLPNANAMDANARRRAGGNAGGLFANRQADPYAPQNNNNNGADDGIPEHLRNHVAPSEPNIATLVEMGFARDRAMQALSESGDSVDLAIALLTAQE